MEHSSGHQELELQLAMDEPQAQQLNHHQWSTLLPLLQEHQVAARADLASSFSPYTTTAIVTNPKNLSTYLWKVQIQYYSSSLRFPFGSVVSHFVFSPVVVGIAQPRLASSSSSSKRWEYREEQTRKRCSKCFLLLVYKYGFSFTFRFWVVFRSFGFNGSKSLSSRVFLGFFSFKLLIVVAKIVRRRLKSF